MIDECALPRRVGLRGTAGGATVRDAGDATEGEPSWAYPRLVLRWVERCDEAERRCAEGWLADLDELARHEAAEEAEEAAVGNAEDEGAGTEGVTGERAREAGKDGAS